MKKGLRLQQATNTYKNALALSLDKDDTIFAVSDKTYFCPDDNSFLYAVFLSLMSQSLYCAVMWEPERIIIPRM